MFRRFQIMLVMVFFVLSSLCQILAYFLFIFFLVQCRDSKICLYLGHMETMFGEIVPRAKNSLIHEEVYFKSRFEIMIWN